MQAKNILVATGSFASKIPIEGAEHAITSDEILNLEALPEKCIPSPQLCFCGLPAISYVDHACLSVFACHATSSKVNAAAQS